MCVFNNSDIQILISVIMQVLLYYKTAYNIFENHNNCIVYEYFILLV